MIDGVYNEKRKLYLLTTNNLYLDSNLLGRPGRICYIKQFGNLKPKAIKEYLNDNLNDKSKAEDVIKAVDTLEISTIDILKAIVDEVNIHGEISEHSMLNVPKARYKIDIIKFDDLKREDFDDFKQFMKDHVPADESLRSWLDKPWRVNEENKQEDNQDMIEDKFDMNCWITQIASSSPVIIKGQHS